jgi:hypothetical protein
MKTVALILAFCLIKFASGQNYIDLFKADYAINQNVYFDSAQVKTRLQEVNLDVTLPIVINKNFALLTGFSYELSNAIFSPLGSAFSVQGATLKVGANIKHNTKWSGTYMLLPKLATDFTNLTKRDLQLGGALLMKYEKHKNFNYKFGAYANSELFSTFVVPIFGFYYLDRKEKLELKVLLPLAGNLNYALTKKVAIGLNFKGQIRSYNLNGNTANYLARSTNDATAYVQYGFKNNLHFQLGIGRAIARSYREYTEKVNFALPLTYFGDTRTQLNQDFEDSFYLKFGVFID